MLIAWGRSGRGAAPAYMVYTSFSINFNSVLNLLHTLCPHTAWQMKANHCIRSPDARSQLCLNFLPHGLAAESCIELGLEKWQLLTCWRRCQVPFIVAWLVCRGKLISLAAERSSPKSKEGKWWRLTHHLSWINEAHKKDNDNQQAVSPGPLKLTNGNF